MKSGPQLRIVVSSAAQAMSCCRSDAGTRTEGSPLSFLTGCLVLALSHPLISEWPPANEKPAAPL
ncbi:MAG TPA: hypothetical protein PKW77_03795 [Verrucomicrobiota bacterium]|nr:hypothetical protein [Verrucomicrobiota bacterium]HPV09565.1 hypothetical protein [Verrucomicrobiota bacterium]HPW79708.1 hypothetical protein [Verrucomicrobiota bacterium]HQF58326.1 hypothetical protein [Verrucomicrobiota bacterium]